VNFDVKGGIREDIKNKLDLVVLVELSNHIFRIFNHAYAGTIMLIMNTLLYRNYRVSEN
jgi:hypothetical protein